MERSSVVRKNTRAGDTEEQMVEIERRGEKVFGEGRLFEIVQECWKDNSRMILRADRRCLVCQ